MVLAPPKPFNGSRGASAESFISQIGLHTISYPERFPDDASKLRFSLSFLTDYAATWAKPYLTKVFDGSPVRFEDFVTDFKSSFFDPNRTHSAEVSLRALRQSGTVAAYTQEFNVHARQIEWDDLTLRSMYQQGLKEKVRLGVIVSGASFESLQAMQAMALRIGTAVEGNRSDSITNIPPPRHTAPAPDPNAMDLSTAAAYNRLSDTERNRRVQLGLCFRCGKPNHQSTDCPNRNRRSQASSRRNNRSNAARFSELQAEINALRSSLTPDPTPPTAESSKNGGPQV